MKRPAPLLLVLALTLAVWSGGPAWAEDAQKAFFDCVEAGTPECIAKAVAAGVDVNAPNSEGRLAIVNAANQGNLPIVEALIEAKVDLDGKATGQGGWTALHAASYAGSVEVVAALLDAKAEVDPRDESGGTPLASASAAGQAAVVRRLLEAGADPNAEGSYGVTPLRAAGQGRHAELCAILVEAGADAVVPMLTAAGSGWGEGVHAMLAAGADVNAADALGRTPLQEAKRKGHEELVAILIEAGARD